MQSNTTFGRLKTSLRSVFTVLCLLIGVMATTNAQTFMNGPLSTGATTSNGAAAPAGNTWSELQTGATILGFAANQAAGFAVADNFTVPAGLPWNLTKITFYAYSTGAAGTVSPFNDIRVQLFNTNPSIGNPTPIFGNLTTNRFLSSSRANIYRIPPATPGTARDVWRIEATVNTTLAAGNYWVEWAPNTTTPGASNFSPPVTIVGAIGAPGANALQHSLTPNTWAPILDGTTRQEMPFDISYTTTCTNAATPTASASPLNSCAGTPVTLRATGDLNNAAEYRWYTGSCGGTLVGTGATLIVSPTVTTTYFVRGEGGCTTPGLCGQVTVTVTPCTCLTPDVATICEGVIQRLSVTGAGTSATLSVASGPVNIPIPDNNPAGMNSPLTATFPAGSSITNMSVNFNITHTWDDDLTINLVAPNGAVLNLVNARGGSGDNFTNTTVSSTSTNPFTANGAPFTGTFRPDAVTAPGTGPTAFTATVGTFTGLYSTPTGTWRLAIRDRVFFDSGILLNWSMNFNYSILPTATWTGGTIFSNAAATTPYIAGTQANAVWVMPSATTTYTATIAAGPCAGANPVTVNVLPRPVVSITPQGACGPVTLTASGAASYSWTPSTGLNTTSGPTVIANPTATTTYTVIGTGVNGCVGVPATTTVNAAPTASVISAVAGATFQIQEGFTAVPPAGWNRQNLSSPGAAIPAFNFWTQGDPGLFPAFNGPANSYALANFNATSGTGTINNWLLTPVVNITNGDVVSFYTRTVPGAAFPDRLEVRLSTNGASTNVGATSTSVGDFTTVLLSVNPNLVVGGGTGTGTSGYPVNWTRLSATVSGITGTVTGRVAFRHFVTNGGPAGANSDNVGVDQVEYATPATVNCANVVTNLTVNITGGVGPYTLVFSNGTTNTTINNYVSGSNIQVSPSATTTYTIVSVTGANGCLGTNNSGSAVITITPSAVITTQPVSATVCAGNNATFTVAATPVTGNTFQWQVSVAGGAFTNIAGATSNTFTVTAPTAAMSGNRYRVIVTGVCAPSVTSAIATLTVNTPAVITTQPVARTICASPSTTGNTTTFTVAATGGDLTYQYQVSTDGGTTFTNVVNGANYSGATTNTLTITNPPATFNNYIYRVLVTSGGCTAVTSSNALLTVNPAPVVVLSASPYEALFPGLTTTLTAAVSSGVGSTFTWFLNGVVLPGASGNTISNLGVNNLGTYTVRVGTTNGCSGLSNAKTLRDSASNNLFVYPNPNNGTFEVRFFNDPTSQNANIARNVIIYDSKGARVYSQRAVILGGTYGPMKVNLTNQPAGVYQIDLVDEKGNRLKTGKVVIL